MKDAAYGMPRLFVRGHDHQGVELGGNGPAWIANAVIPQLQIAPVALLPSGSHVIEKVERPIMFSSPIMGIVDMRIEKIILGHQADPGGVKHLIREDPTDAGNIRDESDHPGVLKRIDDLLHSRVVPVHLDADVLVLAQRPIPHHLLLRRKGGVNLLSAFLIQQIREDKGAHLVAGKKLPSQGVPARAQSLYDPANVSRFVHASLPRGAAPSLSYGRAPPPAGRGAPRARPSAPPPPPWPSF